MQVNYTHHHHHHHHHAAVCLSITHTHTHALRLQPTDPVSSAGPSCCRLPDGPAVPQRVHLPLLHLSPTSPPLPLINQLLNLSSIHLNRVHERVWSRQSLSAGCSCRRSHGSRRAAAATPNTRYSPNKALLTWVRQSRAPVSSSGQSMVPRAGQGVSVRRVPLSLLRIQTMAIFLLHRSRSAPLRTLCFRSAALTAHHRLHLHLHLHLLLHRLLQAGPPLEPEPL